VAEAVSFPEATATIAQPGGGVADLFEPCGLVGDGPGAAKVTCWRLSFLELSEVCRTGVVWVSMRGAVHPEFFVSGHRAEALDQG
jgi:hypothetical protein